MALKKKLLSLVKILLRDADPPIPVVAGLFDDESSFLEAAKNLKGVSNLQAVTPYPVHGLDEILKIKSSWIPWVAFIFGLMGLAGGLALTWFTSVVSWPLIIGGKPFFSLPAFIPVIFECTILFSALASVAALFYACDLPRLNPPLLNTDLTSHKFALYAPVEGNNKETVLSKLKEVGAKNIIEGVF